MIHLSVGIKEQLTKAAENLCLFEQSAFEHSACSSTLATGGVLFLRGLLLCSYVFLYKGLFKTWRETEERL